MAKAQGRYRRWKSLQQAMKSVCLKSEVNEMAARMKALRDELQFHILVQLKQEIDVDSLQQSDRYDTLSKISKQILKDFRAGQDALLGSLDSLKTSLMNRQNNSESLIVEPGGRIITSTERHMEILSHSQQHLHDGDHRQRRHQVARADYTLVEKAILKSFCFEGIHDRHESIVTAHENTFAWIFEDPAIHNRPWDSFVAWLQSGSGIYWINGKAASGKSTLMKFLLKNPMLKEHLLTWSSRARLLCAEFFFWNLGSQLQKTQTGLLRQRTSLIAASVPELWRRTVEKEDKEICSLHDGWYLWSLTNLKQLFRQILATVATDVDFCFFIDGLDEFDGDHTVIVGFFNELSLIPKASVYSLQALGKELASIYLKVGRVEERNLEMKSLT